MKLSFFALFLGCALFATASARAEQPLQREYAKAVVNLLFNRLDCDLDGTVEPSEVDDHIAQLWHPIDNDRSRSLSPKEYAMSHRALAADGEQALFDNADANRDGQISVDEYRAHVKRAIVAVDTDGDREATRLDAGLNPWPKPFAKRIVLNADGDKKE